MVGRLAQSLTANKQEKQNLNPEEHMPLDCFLQQSTQIVTRGCPCTPPPRREYARIHGCAIHFKLCYWVCVKALMPPKLWSAGISFSVLWEAGSGTIAFSPEEIHPCGGEDSLLVARWSARTPPPTPHRQKAEPGLPVPAQQLAAMPAVTVPLPHPQSQSVGLLLLLTLEHPSRPSTSSRLHCSCSV